MEFRFTPDLLKFNKTDLSLAVPPLDDDVIDSKFPFAKVSAAAVSIVNKLPLVIWSDVIYIAVPEFSGEALKTKSDAVVFVFVLAPLKVCEPLAPDVNSRVVFAPALPIDVFPEVVLILVDVEPLRVIVPELIAAEVKP